MHKKTNLYQSRQFYQICFFCKTFNSCTISVVFVSYFFNFSFIAHSDLQGIRTTAKKDGDDWILNGSKVFITNGWMADVVIVVAVTDVDAKSPAHGVQSP